MLHSNEFTAPEVYAGGLFDEKIDEYAAGIVMYHLLTQKYPFKMSP